MSFLQSPPRRTTMHFRIFILRTLLILNPGIGINSLFVLNHTILKQCLVSSQEDQFKEVVLVKPQDFADYELSKVLLKRFP